MTQVRFIIIHPQTNASFIRRLTSMSESSKIALEFYTDISTLKKHQPVLDSSVVVVVQNTQFSLELQAYCVENNNRVVCWGSSLIAEKKLDNPTIWHCLGDPFSGRNFQTVITLMSTDISKEWIYNGKWGGLSHEIYATPQETMDQLQSFLQKFKLTGQINTSYWNALAKNI